MAKDKPTAREQLPADLDRIAGEMPESPHGFARLRELHGLLPNPLAPTFPNQGGGGQQQSVDPNQTASQLGNFGVPGLLGLGMTPGSTLVQNSVDSTAIADALGAVKLVTSNPTLPDASYPPGTLIFNTTSNLLYKNVADAWVAIVNATDMTGQITTTQITDNAITTPKLTANSVTTAKLAAGSVTANELAANSVIAGKIQAGAISATEIAAGAITTSKLTVAGIDIGTIATAGSVTNGALAANSVTTAKLAANSVDATKIAAGAITASDITSGTMSADRINGGAITASDLEVGGSSSFHLYVKNGSGTVVGSWVRDGGTGSALTLGTGPSVSITSAGNGGVVAGLVVGTVGGIRTVAVSGIGSVDSSAASAGGIVLDTSSSPHRLYTHDGSAWHYAVMDAGVTVPAHEVRCPVCEKLMGPGDDLIARGDRWQHDGALHALWIHSACAGKALGPNRLDDQYEAAHGNPGLLVKLEGIVRGLLARKGIATKNPR